MWTIQESLGGGQSGELCGEVRASPGESKAILKLGAERDREKGIFEIQN